VLNEKKRRESAVTPSAINAVKPQSIVTENREAANAIKKTAPDKRSSLKKRGAASGSSTASRLKRG